MAAALTSLTAGAETPDPADFSPPCLSPTGIPGAEGQDFRFSSLSQEEIKFNFAYNSEWYLQQSDMRDGQFAFLFYQRICLHRKRKADPTSL